MAIAVSLDRYTATADRFLTWWKQELVACVPARVRNRFDLRRKAPLIVVSGGVVSRPDSHHEGTGEGARIGDEDAAEVVDRMLAGRADRGSRPTGVRLTLPVAECFRREVRLPAQAAQNLDEILALDIARATPFHVDEIYHAHVARRDPENPSSLLVDHLIVKREKLDDPIEFLRESGRAVMEATAFEQDPTRELPVNFIASVNSRPKRSLVSFLNRLLAVAAVAITAALVLILFERQEHALAQLDRDLAIAKERAMSVRQSFDELRAKKTQAGAAVRRKLETPSVVEIWNELTRVLPDDTWLADIRISGGQVQINGYTKASPRLLELIEASTSFAEAAFAAPVTLDNGRKRERFSIRFKLADGPGLS